MLTLYDYLPSQNAWKVRVLLGLLGIAYETRIVSIFEGESRTEAFLKLNPAGAVPVLAVEKGQARLFDEIRYRFYLTNDRAGTDRELVLKANDRGDQQNLIAQLNRELEETKQF